MYVVRALKDTMSTWRQEACPYFVNQYLLQAFHEMKSLNILTPACSIDACATYQ